MPAGAPQWEQANPAVSAAALPCPNSVALFLALIERLNHCVEIDSENSCDAAGHPH